MEEDRWRRRNCISSVAFQQELHFLSCNPAKLDATKYHIHLEGGTGYIFRQLGSGWVIIPTGYELLNGIEDLLDRMNMVMQS